MSSELAPKSRQNRVQKKFGTHMLCSQALIHDCGPLVAAICPPKALSPGIYPQFPPSRDESGQNPKNALKICASLRCNLLKLSRARAIGVPTLCLLGVWVVGGGGGTHPVVTVGGTPHLLPSGFGLLRRGRDRWAVTVGGNPPHPPPTRHRPRRPTPPPTHPPSTTSPMNPRFNLRPKPPRPGGKVTRPQPPVGCLGCLKLGVCIGVPFSPRCNARVLVLPLLSR